MNMNVRTVEPWLQLCAYSCIIFAAFSLEPVPGFVVSVGSEPRPAVSARKRCASREDPVSITTSASYVPDGPGPISALTSIRAVGFPATPEGFVVFTWLRFLFLLRASSCAVAVEPHTRARILVASATLTSWPLTGGPRTVRRVFATVGLASSRAHRRCLRTGFGRKRWRHHL